MERIFFVIGSLSAFVGVAAGAFGAHGLEGRMSTEMLSVFEVGVRYQMYHALALMAAAPVRSRWPSALVDTAGGCFAVGTVVFSGHKIEPAQRLIGAQRRLMIAEYTGDFMRRLVVHDGTVKEYHLPAGAGPLTEYLRDQFPDDAGKIQKFKLL